VEQTGAVFSEQFPGSEVLVVADENTYRASGEEVLASMRAAGVRFACAPHVFPGTPTLRTSYEQVTVVRELLAALPDAVCCAIAAGTINDVVKLSSGDLGRP
jgi:glycerol-1-phosphate dehydrogenase [NAD(P)+]